MCEAAGVISDLISNQLMHLKNYILKNCSWLKIFETTCMFIVDNPPFVFYFRVKFYVSEPSKLKEEYTRYCRRLSLYFIIFGASCFPMICYCIGGLCCIMTHRIHILKQIKIESGCLIAVYVRFSASMRDVTLKCKGQLYQH